MKIAHIPLYRCKARNTDEFINLTACNGNAYATSTLWLCSLCFRKTQRYSLLEDKSVEKYKERTVIKWNILMHHPGLYLCFFSVMIHSTLPCFNLKCAIASE